MTVLMRTPGTAMPLDFEEEAAQAVNRLRTTFSGLIAEIARVSKKPIRTGADLQRALNIRSTLAWQFFRVANAPAPLEEAHAVPGAKAIANVLEAAKTCGVADGPIQQVSEALDAFDEMIRANAGSRKTFRSMVASVGSNEANNVDLQYRRDAFHANGHIWGAQVDTNLRCNLIHPGSSPDMADFLSIRGMQAIRRLRPNVSFRVSTVRLFRPDKSLQDLESIEPSDAIDTPGPALLTEFCSQPVPQLIHRRRAGDGALESLLAPSDIGNRGAATVYMADMARNFNWRTPDRPCNEFRSTTTVRHPTRMLVLDILVYRGMFSSLKPRIEVYGDMSEAIKADPAQWDQEHRLPANASIRRMGATSSAVATPDIPNYPDILRHVCSRIGWDADHFEVFRFQWEYPVMSSTVSIWLELPESGNW